MRTFAQRLSARLEKIRNMQGVHLRQRRRYFEQVSGKRGIEIGGPSEVFRAGQPLDLYAALEGLDNCNFSASTVWEQNQQSAYTYAPGRPPGRSIFCEGSDLAEVAGASYDFVLSSHNLEHFANPVKALTEWKRILRPRGTLVLALPDHRKTFDHRRTPTTVEHMMRDFEQQMGEDDLTHVDEIVARHDLSIDPGGNTPEQFLERSRRNIENRCLHHHVFNTTNSRELLERVGFEVLSVDIAEPCHLLLLAKLR